MHTHTHTSTQAYLQMHQVPSRYTHTHTHTHTQHPSLTCKMIPLRTCLESTPTFRSSRHSLSNFSGVSWFSMLQMERGRSVTITITHTHTRTQRAGVGCRSNLPSHFSEDGVVPFFIVAGVAISSSASGRNPFLDARTWGLPQELAVEQRSQSDARTTQTTNQIQPQCVARRGMCGV